jgi:HEAT repeat protein
LGNERDLVVKRGKRVAVILAGCGIVGLMVALWPGERDPEPKYQWKKLSEWLDDWYLNNEQATVAIQQIGTNALPWLLKTISYEPSENRKKQLALIKKLPLKPFRGRIENFIEGGREDRALSSIDGFRALGRTAAPAVAELARLMNGTNRVAGRAIMALAAIGEEGLPALQVPLRDERHPMHRVVYYFVAEEYKNMNCASNAVPMLLGCLKDPDAQVVAGAASKLGYVGLEPGVCVPALTNLLQHTNHSVQTCAIDSLGRFGSDSRSASTVLAAYLSDPDRDIRLRATNALRKIAPEVLTNGVANGSPSP